MSDLARLTAPEELQHFIGEQEREIARLQRERDQIELHLIKMAEKCERLRAALEAILKANDEFRAQLPPDWEGDPLNDACVKARKTLADEEPEFAIDKLANADEWLANEEGK